MGLEKCTLGAAVAVQRGHVAKNIPMLRLGGCTKVVRWRLGVKAKLPAWHNGRCDPRQGLLSDQARSVPQCEKPDIAAVARHRGARKLWQFNRPGKLVR